ncbi:hypothetical protein [Dyella sp. ASV21]|uniref:hypothetical protein n=1 Tax=Dyella sp. ASV21 TaxID=2795114 RepID=UPI0018EBEDE6|nr:hypothetical protein [Dyella sp. ASV21]
MSHLRHSVGQKTTILHRIGGVSASHPSASRRWANEESLYGVPAAVPGFRGALASQVLFDLKRPGEGGAVAIAQVPHAAWEGAWVRPIQNLSDTRCIAGFFHRHLDGFTWMALLCSAIPLCHFPAFTARFRG